MADRKSDDADVAPEASQQHDEPAATPQQADMYAHFKRLGFNRRCQNERWECRITHHARHIDVVIDSVQHLMQQLSTVADELDQIKTEMKSAEASRDLDYLMCKPYTIEKLRDMARSFNMRPIESKRDMCERLIEWFSREGFQVPPPPPGPPPRTVMQPPPRTVMQ